MNQQDTLILRGLELKLDRILDSISNFVKDEKNEEKISEMKLGEWVTLTQAWELQGRIFSLATIRARADLQPCMGHGTMIGRNKCWRKPEVIEWLNAVTPEERKAYRIKYSGGK